MKYAILNSGGKQYVAREGETIEVDRLPHEIGNPVEFKEILLVADNGDIAVGAPTVKGAMVKGRVLDQIKAAKIIVFKYVPKQRYRRKQGHRQRYTRVAIDEISFTATAEKKAATKDEPKKAVAKDEPKQAAVKDMPTTAPAKATTSAASKTKTTSKEKPKSATKTVAKKSPASKSTPKKTAKSTAAKKTSSTKSSTAKKPSTKSTKAASKKTESKSSTKSSSEKSTKDKKK